MKVKTEVFTYDYTYEDLVKLGKENPQSSYTNLPKSVEAYIANSKYARIPVLDDGKVVWTNKPSKNQVEEYSYYIWGMMCVCSNLTNDPEVTAYQSYYRPTDNYAPIAAFQYGFKNEERAEGGATYEKAAEVWELPRNLNVASKAALFYLLYTRTLRGDQKAKDELDFYIAELAPIISRYLDMAAAGELRHMLREGYTWKDGVAPKDVEEQAWKEKHVKKDSGGHLLLNVTNSVANANMKTDNRTLAWIHWRAIREESPIGSLNWCIMQHCLSQRGGFGGALWANCANLVRKRELGEVSDVFFVDQAFSLQHNGGAIFNKLWDVNHLQHVLDFAFRGEVEKLPKYLLKEDALRWRKVSGFVSALDMEHNDKHMASPEKVLDKFEKSTVLGIEAQAVLETISK